MDFFDANTFKFLDINADVMIPVINLIGTRLAPENPVQFPGCLV